MLVTRGNDLRLLKTHFKYDLRKYYFLTEWLTYGTAIIGLLQLKTLTLLREDYSGVARGGHWCMSPRHCMGKFFKSSRFGYVATGYDTLLKFWSADY